ncbi:MAG TPA: DUF4041 domain-containing protein [Rhizomicrobium sp.]|jgi:hypothetical protein
MTAILLGAGDVAFLALACWMSWQLMALRRHYAPILDVDVEISARKKALAILLDEQARTAKQIEGGKQDDAARHAREDASLADMRRRAEEEVRQNTDTFRAKFKAAAEDDARRHQEQEDALAKARQKHDEELARAQAEFDSRNTALNDTLARMQREVDALEENLEDISCGLYKPHYDFSTSAEYKATLDDICARQKSLIHAGTAAHFANSWTINGSTAEGAKMQKQYGKLLLRAFNGECDASIAKVSWNNMTRMEERIRKSFDAINELGGVMHISLAQDYLDLRVEELRLAFETEDKKHAEAEEQRRIRTKMREEEKVQRELEEAKRKAEADEEHYSHALEAARAEVGSATGAKLEHLNSKIEELQRQLTQAQMNKERAISQAQLTKSGHIYVVSNIGSFGDGVYKIGMTRRLDPRERIDELSDASVPFGFDVHGMIHSDDAPALEHELHQHFEDRQLNRINRKKEFFRISLDELDTFARSKSLKLELTMMAEAREYRQTQALLEQLKREIEQAKSIRS